MRITELTRTILLPLLFSAVFFSAHASPIYHWSESEIRGEPAIETIDVVPQGEDFEYGKRFEEILKQLRQHSAKSDIPPDSVLFQIAIDAIMKRIGDVHGAHFSPRQFERFQSTHSPSHYTGIGAQLAGSKNGALIVQVFEDSPLKFSGIRPGDHIVGAGEIGEPKVTFDSRNIGQSIREMAAKIKGPEGTDVALHIKRGGSDLGEIIVQRVRTRLQHIFVKMSDSGILNVRITQFGSTVQEDLLTLLQHRNLLVDTGREDDEGNTIWELSGVVKGLVIDVRNDPGGSLRTAVQISDMLLEKDKPIVGILSRVDGSIMMKSENDPLFGKHIPVVMLANGGSASASEILTGAVVANDRGWFFGEKTYGKGSVQSLVPLEGGGAIKTTTAIYLAAGRVEIDGVGIEPNINITMPGPPGVSDDAKRINRHLIFISMDPDIDRQLAVAHKFLLGFINGPYSMNAEQSILANMENAETASTNITPNLCKEKNLYGCPD